MKKILLLLCLNIFSIALSTALAQVPSYVPTNGLVGWWPFNGNANDESGNGNNGTVNGATLTTDRFGVANKAYSFDGVNDFIQTNRAHTSSFSVSTWVKLSSAACFSSIIDAYASSWEFLTDCNSGSNLSLAVWSGGTYQIYTSGFNLTPQNWTHVVCTFSANNTCKIYSNGVLINTFTTINLPAIGGLFYFGRSRSGSDSFLNGVLDDIGIWNRALTACEITDLYNSQLNSFVISGGPDQNICNGEAIVLSGIGGTTYSWNNNVLNNISFIPSTSTAYTVSSTNATGCTNSDQVQVTVNPLPIVNAGSDQSVCAGTAVTLSASGATSYAWDNNVMDDIAFTPTTSGTYTVTGTNVNGCVNTDQVVVTVNALPTVNAGADQSVCAGTAVTLSASGASAYAWNNNVSNAMAFTPTTSGTYSVTGTDANGCVNLDQVLVTVNPLPTVNAGADQSICKGAAVTLSGTGATTYAWNNNVSNGVAFNPIATATYSVSGTDANGCTNADEVIVTVNEASASTLTESAMDSYTLNGQTYTQSGTYTQTLTNAVGCDSTITLNLTLSFTGLGELAQAIRIFPNPANDILNIESTSPLIGEYTMYDAAGRVILHGTFTGMTTSIDVRNIAPGTYTLQAKELLERVVVLRR